MTRCRAFLLFILGATLVMVSGCFEDRLSGKACDEEHACIDGWVCVNEVCIRGDGGTVVDEDAGTSDAGELLDAGTEDAGAPLDGGTEDAGTVDAGLPPMG